MGYGYFQPDFPSPTATPESNLEATEEGQEEERDGGIFQQISAESFCAFDNLASEILIIGLRIYIAKRCD